MKINWIGFQKNSDIRDKICRELEKKEISIAEIPDILKYIMEKLGFNAINYNNFSLRYYKDTPLECLAIFFEHKDSWRSSPYSWRIDEDKEIQIHIYF
jgi:hypothetical protein